MPCCCGWRQDHVHVATWCRLLLSCAATAAAVSECYWLIIAHPLWRFYPHESSLLILSSSCVHFLSKYSACSYGLALLVHWAIFYTCTCITLLRIDKSALLSVETTVLLERGVLHNSQELNLKFFVQMFSSSYGKITLIILCLKNTQGFCKSDDVTSADVLGRARVLSSAWRAREAPVSSEAHGRDGAIVEQWGVQQLLEPCRETGEWWCCVAALSKCMNTYM